jgi:hypothetical protein
LGRVVRRGNGLLFMCGQDEDSPHCDCGGYGDYLCDYPVGNDNTCSKPLCERHRHSVAPEIDYCDLHYAEWEEYRNTGAPLRHFKHVIPFRRERDPRFFIFCLVYKAKAVE